MARIPYFDPEQAPERVLRAMAGKRKINIFRMIANSENSAPEVLALGQTLSKGSSLDPAHREVVILRVAHLTNAAYQWHEHTTVAKRVGFTVEKIDAIATYTSREPGVILARSNEPSSSSPTPWSSPQTHPTSSSTPSAPTTTTPGSWNSFCSSAST